MVEDKPDDIWQLPVRCIVHGCDHRLRTTCARCGEPDRIGVSIEGAWRDYLASILENHGY